MLNNEWANYENREVINKFLAIKENEHTAALNLWDTTKAVLGGKFIAIQAYLKEIQQIQIKNLNLHLQELEEQQQIKPRASRRK